MLYLHLTVVLRGEVLHMIGPFIRWAGGKRWFCNQIIDFLPQSFTDYYEPFLGGGSVFFELKKNNLINHCCFLSDLNNQLINSYKMVRDNPQKLIKWLKQKEGSEEEYYQIRTHFNLHPEYSSAGAEFIYLNKHSFNGIYRVNKSGEYNVPYGGHRAISDDYYKLIERDSEALKDCVIEKHNFKYLLNKKISPSSFVFIDPPYTVSHNNNGFIAYNKKLFSLDDQYKLLEVLDWIDKCDAYFLMTNAHHKIIKEIFGKYNFYECSRKSVIGGRNAKRQTVSEYIICNYSIKGVGYVLV